MGLAKRIGKSEALRGALCAMTAAYIRGVAATGRWRVSGDPTAARMWDEGRPFILAFWHGRILMMPKIWRPGVPIHMLISQHRDGQLIARTVRHFGIATVAGSTTRGGGAALRAMLKALKAGECVGITPDGPRGPRMRASAGIVAVARLSGCPVIPASWASPHRHVLGTWDRFAIPLPFTRGELVWGAPIFVAADADAQAQDWARLEIESALNRLTAEADARMGADSPIPAPPVEGPAS